MANARARVDEDPAGPPPGWALIGSLTKSETARQAGRQRLLGAARVCFATKGYGGTVVSEIAEAAEVSIGSVYKYVRSKEDLLWLLAEEAHRTFRNAIDDGLVGHDDSALDALLATVDAFIRVAHDNADLMTIFQSEFKYMPDACRVRVQEQDAYMVNLIAGIIRIGVEAGQFTCPDPHFVAVTIGMMPTTWIMKRRLLGMSLEDYIRAQQDVARALVRAS